MTCTMGLEPPAHWGKTDSAKFPRRTDNCSGHDGETSDALLQSRHWESLHDRASRLCLHKLHLAEDLPLAGLGGWLDPGLDPDEAWEGKEAGLLDLLRTNCSKARDDLACNVLLDLKLGSMLAAMAPLVICLPAFMA